MEHVPEQNGAPSPRPPKGAIVLRLRARAFFAQWLRSYSPLHLSGCPATERPAPRTMAAAPAQEENLDLGKVQRWLCCVCVVNFDVDFGQVIEHQVPAKALTEEEATALCYMSFPDSHATSLGDTEFIFRIQRSASVAEHHASTLRPSDDEVEDPLLGGGLEERPPFEDATHSRRYLYGFTLFRQRKDPSHPRGTFQKSMVVVTPLPYVKLYRAMAQLLAPVYFAQGPSGVARALAEISRWPDVAGGQIVELPLLKKVIRCRLCMMSAELGHTALYNPSPGSSARVSPSPLRPVQGRAVPPSDAQAGTGALAAVDAPAWSRTALGRSAEPPQATRCASAGTHVSARSLTPPACTRSASSVQLPPQPSLTDVLQSTTAGYAPFQDISLLQAFAPGPNPGAAANSSALAVTASGVGQGPGAGPAGSGVAGESSGAASSPAPVYEAMWAYWELVLTGTSILVHSTSPTRCSDAVLALVSLIAPIPFCGDFRPYFTIHDADFERYTSSPSEPPPAADGSGRGIILGVTNPYFLKMRQPWHSLVALDQLSTEPSVATAIGDMLQSSGGTSTLTDVSVRSSGSAARRRSPVVNGDAVILKQLHDLLGASEAGSQRQVPSIQQSPAAARLQRAGRSDSDESLQANAQKIANEMLRQHFRDLTCKFLRPLEVYGTRGFIPPTVDDWARDVTSGDSGQPSAWMQTFDRDRFLRELVCRAARENPSLPSSWP